jgi:hypothetical protein
LWHSCSSPIHLLIASSCIFFGLFYVDFVHCFDVAWRSFDVYSTIGRNFVRRNSVENSVCDHLRPFAPIDTYT